jgi:hypothetical protein
VGSAGVMLRRLGSFYKTNQMKECPADDISPSAYFSSRITQQSSTKFSTAAHTVQYVADCILVHIHIYIHV